MLEGVVIDDTELFNDKLQERENFYNFNRPNGGLDGQTPYERLRQKTTKTKARASTVPVSCTTCPRWESNPHALASSGF